MYISIEIFCIDAIGVKLYARIVATMFIFAEFIVQMDARSMQEQIQFESEWPIENFEINSPI